MKSMKGESMLQVVVLVAGGLFVLLGGVGGCMWGLPKYKVYSAEMRGRAVLAEAESSRQVAVREALAMKDSAKYKAEAEIIRSQGIADSNQIVGDSLKGNSEYLTYLWIDMMRDTRNQLIYVPTEAGLPITESSRLAPRTVTVAPAK